MLITLTDVSYSYPSVSRMALRHISLTVPEGQFCAIVGANGAGKSTLCYTLAGFIPHFFHGKLRGSVQVAGFDVTESSLGEMAGSIGLVVQNPFNQITGARFTVFEEVAFGLENLGLARDEIIVRSTEALELTGLAQHRDQSPYTLSGGQQQRLAIAAMLAMRPKVLILDEPTSQLDPVGTREVFGVLRGLAEQRSMTIVLVEHKLEWIAQFADRVIALARGQVAADGSPGEVLASPLMQEIGIGTTRYTQAARHAQAAGLAEAERSLPVTLNQAVEFFSRVTDSSEYA
jgi:energy-coupling factor transporter ATP-binding protein EcfA2